jgi:hypothetical protein
VTQEGIHLIKIKNKKDLTLNVDLSKCFDHVSWLYLRLILIHLCFSHAFVTWLMSYICSASFAIILNGDAYPLFKPKRGIRQGCPLSPILFLLVEEGLSRYLRT